MKKKKQKRFTVYDCCASCPIKEYNSRYWADKRRTKEIESRNLLPNGIAVLKNF